MHLIQQLALGQWVLAKIFTELEHSHEQDIWLKDHHRFAIGKSTDGITITLKQSITTVFRFGDEPGTIQTYLSPYSFCLYASQNTVLAMSP